MTTQVVPGMKKNEIQRSLLVVLSLLTKHLFVAATDSMRLRLLLTDPKFPGRAAAVRQHLTLNANPKF